MNRLRTGGNARISFFSFQDIITSVTGILILVTLMLSFSVTTAEDAPSEEQRIESARSRLKQIEAENERLQQRRLEAAALPDPAQTRTQVETLKQEQAELEKQREQLQAKLAAARERLEKQATQKEESAAELRGKIAALEPQLEELREKASRAKTNVNVVYIVPDAQARQNPKAPVAMIVSGERLRAQRLNGADVFETQISSAYSLASALARHNPERDFVVFYFRPSGVKWFDAFREMARQRGFEVGYDAVEEQKEVIFSAP
jgi:hypothetical protein